MKKMKKSIMFAVLYLCFVNVMYAQGERCQYKYADLDFVNGKMIVISTGLPVYGLVCSYHTNGNILNEIPYKDGKIEGIEKFYDVSGKLEKETLHKECTYKINGICTTEDIGGVQIYKVSVASPLSVIDKQIAELTATISAPLPSCLPSGLDYRRMGRIGLTTEMMEQGIQRCMQAQQLNLQRQQMLLQTLLQTRAMQSNNQQTTNDTYRLKFENNNNFTVNVIFEVQERGFGVKITRTIFLTAHEIWETTDTFIDPINIISITRKIIN